MVGPIHNTYVFKRSKTMTKKQSNDQTPANNTPASSKSKAGELQFPSVKAVGHYGGLQWQAHKLVDPKGTQNRDWFLLSQFRKEGLKDPEALGALYVADVESTMGLDDLCESTIISLLKRDSFEVHTIARVEKTMRVRANSLDREWVDKTYEVLETQVVTITISDEQKLALATELMKRTRKAWPRFKPTQVGLKWAREVFEKAIELVDGTRAQQTAAV